MYAQDELEISGDHKFYIKDIKDGIEKSPIQYAIDNNKKLGRRDQYPVIYAIQNNYSFNNGGTEINTSSAIAEYALKSRKIEDNYNLIKYVINNSIKIQDKDPIVYFQEQSMYIKYEDNLSPL